MLIGTNNNMDKSEVRLNSMPWFHGKIRREEAEAFLTPREVSFFFLFKKKFYAA